MPLENLPKEPSSVYSQQNQLLVIPVGFPDSVLRRIFNHPLCVGGMSKLKNSSTDAQQQNVGARGVRNAVRGLDHDSGGAGGDRRCRVAAGGADRARAAHDTPSWGWSAGIPRCNAELQCARGVALIRDADAAGNAIELTGRGRANRGD